MTGKLQTSKTGWFYDGHFKCYWPNDETYIPTSRPVLQLEYKLYDMQNRCTIFYIDGRST